MKVEGPDRYLRILFVFNGQLLFGREQIQVINQLKGTRFAEILRKAFNRGLTIR
jgi:cyanophycinase-like exopeptidase